MVAVDQIGVGEAAGQLRAAVHEERAPVTTLELGDVVERAQDRGRPPPVDEIGVAFQPIVDLPRRRPFAYEALVRCRRPGFERPDELLAAALAERAMGRLGRLIREVALPPDRDVPVFVNLHPEERGEVSKVGVSDECILMDSIDCPWLGSMVVGSPLRLVQALVRRKRERHSTR